MSNPEDTQDSSVELTGKPDEIQLAILTMLMRLYDIQLAALNSMDPNRANEVYEAHEAGKTFNPPMYIPVFEEQEKPVESKVDDSITNLEIFRENDFKHDSIKFTGRFYRNGERRKVEVTIDHADIEKINNFGIDVDRMADQWIREAIKHGKDEPVEVR